MRKIETAEQARVWLYTYETCMTRSCTQQESIDAADRAVEAWRERVGTSDQPRAEDADLRTQRDAARALLEDVRKALKADKVPDTGLAGVAAIVLAANEALRREREEATAAHCRAVGERDVAQQRLEERCAELKAISDALPHGEGATLERVKALAAERNSIQEDLAAMKERLAVAEGQLAGVRIILEAAGVPARGTLEERLRAGLVELTDALRAGADCAERIKAEDVKTRRALADLVVEHHEGQLHEHQGYDLLTCQKLICYRMREILGAGWLDVLRAAGRRESGAGAKAP